MQGKGGIQQLATQQHDATHQQLPGTQEARMAPKASPENVTHQQVLRIVEIIIVSSHHLQAAVHHCR